MGLTSCINNWKKRRVERATEQKRLNNLFEQFLVETKPMTPKASIYPEAALLRHAWKRAAILSDLFKDIPNKEREYLYSNFAEIAGSRYYRIAPTNVYGKVRLRLEPEAARKLLEREKELLFPRKKVSARSRELACIYLGVDDKGKYYVGQTIDAPEYRWVQHRANNTGPYKKGSKYVDWKILEGNINPFELNRKESYYIGFCNSMENGHNDTRGNNLTAYELGIDNYKQGREQDTKQLCLFEL